MIVFALTKKQRNTTKNDLDKKWSGPMSVDIITLEHTSKGSRECSLPHAKPLPTGVDVHNWRIVGLLWHIGTRAAALPTKNDLFKQHNE